MARTIGVDVGGTKVAVAALDGAQLGEPATEPTCKDATDALVDQLVRMINGLGPADAVGLGLPSAIDIETGTARFSPNIPLTDVPIRDILSERLGIPVHVANDAQVAGLSEAYDDQLQLVTESLVMLTLGTGVGGAIVLGGDIYYGAGGAAGHMGHQLIAADLSAGAPAHTDDPPQPGTIESLASGTALDAMAAGAGFGDARGVVAATGNGDAEAERVMSRYCTALGLGIANAINTFDPGQVVIGGGLSAAGDQILGPASEVARNFTLRGLGTRTEIRLARDRGRAGVRGAALLAARSVQ